MSGINKATIIGRLGKDPEVRHLEAGSTVASFSVAVSEKFKNKAGEVVENTEWLNIVAWNKRAEVVEKYVKKGMLVYVEGKIKTRNYDKDGQKHYVTEIFAETIQMLSKSETQPQQESANETSQAREQNSPPSEELDDLPF